MKMTLRSLLSTVTLLTGLLIFSLTIHAGGIEKPVIQVKRVGSGDPVILIPGLMSDGSVWDGTVEALSSDYQLHIVNVAGFGKTPKAKNTTAASVEQAIVNYARQQGLPSPVVIGHSFGGFLAMALAVNPDINVKKAISVDGLPYIGPIFTRTNATSVEDLRAQAGQLKSLYHQLNHDQLVAQTRQGIAIQASSPEAQQVVLDSARQSDPATVGQIMHDLMLRDLRPSLAGDTTPILLLGASGAFQSNAQHEYAQELYAGQLAQAPDAEVIMNTQARHFIMLDDPAWLHQHITAFLGE